MKIPHLKLRKAALLGAVALPLLFAGLLCLPQTAHAAEGDTVAAPAPSLSQQVASADSTRAVAVAGVLAPAKYHYLGLEPTLRDGTVILTLALEPADDTDLRGALNFLVLTDDGMLQKRIADPRHKLPKTYLAQVEGVPDEAALARLRAGVDLGDFVTRPCAARLVAEPAWLWPRNPPIRERKAIPTSWIELVLREGKNRQVRRMTAKVGFPTLRLIRCRIGDWTLEGLAPGQWRELAITMPMRLRRLHRADDHPWPPHAQQQSRQ